MLTLEDLNSEINVRLAGTSSAPAEIDLEIRSYVAQLYYGSATARAIINDLIRESRKGANRQRRAVIQSVPTIVLLELSSPQKLILADMV